MFSRNRVQNCMCLGIMLSLFLFGCKKRETMQNDSKAQSLIDNALVSQEFNSLVPLAIQSLMFAEKNNYTGNFCDKIQLISGDTSDFLPNPVYQISISENECSMFYHDFKKRSGQIFIRVTGSVKSEGTLMCLKLNNYVADNLSYTCDSLLMFLQTKYDSGLVVNTRLVNSQCTGQSYRIQYSSANQVNLIQKNEVSNSFAFKTSSSSGQSKGTNRFGIVFSTLSSGKQPVVMNLNCRYFVTGEEELINDAEPAMKINYGNGNCDETATYNIFENTLEFKLK